MDHSEVTIFGPRVIYSEKPRLKEVLNSIGKKYKGHSNNACQPAEHSRSYEVNSKLF